MKGTVFLRFLGTVQVEREGELVKRFGSRKALALLGYLVVQDQAVPRARLADLFWENKPAARGRANLSWVQRRLSKLLPGCLKADHHTVEFQRGEGYWLDVDAFAELEAQGKGKAEALMEAVGLYRGEFLEGLCLVGCPEFEIWLAGERERWRNRVASALEELVACHGGRGEYEEGLQFGRRLLELEPWREAAHQEVMRLLAWSGRRGAALAQYKACCRALAEELGVKPAEETVRLYERIRDGEVKAPEVVPPRLAGVRARPPSFLNGETASDVERPVFVARERELERLRRYLEAALAGRGQVVFVTGNAGQGKTMLIQEFARRAQVDHPELVVADGNGNAHTGVGDPYLPFREVLGLLTGDVETRWAAGAISRERGRRLWDLLPVAVQVLVEEGPDLVETFLLGRPLVGRARAFAPGGAEWLGRLEELLGRKAVLPGGPGPQQGNLFEQYRRVVRELAGQRPLLLILDDLQWADVGSIDLLFHLGRGIEGCRVLIVGAYRPAEVALGRNGKRHPLESVVNELKLQSGEIEVDLWEGGRQFVETFLDTEPNRLGEPFRETLYRQTGGHPLFTVELLRGMQERGDLVQDDEGQWIEGGALDWETLPPRVEAVIAERVGRLAEPLQRTLRVASVEGETFTAEVVARVEGVEEREVVERLSEELDKRHHLVRARGLERVGPGRLSRYRFRHILFQRYLYSGLDAVERAHLHEAVGDALEGLYGEGTEELAAAAPQLAWHFREAGIVEKAVEYLGRAGERAVRLSANEEAIVHFTQALALLATLPDTPERAQQELMLQLGLGVPLLAARGFGAPGLGHAYARAWELCQQIGETPQLPLVMWQLAIFYTTRGEYGRAQEIGERLVGLVDQLNDRQHAPYAHCVRGLPMIYLGELTQARAHLERALACYDAGQHRVLLHLYGADAAVLSASFVSFALWLLGYPDQSLQRSQEAVALAEELEHPTSLVTAQGVGAACGMLRRDAAAALLLAEACIALSREHSLPYWLASGVYIRGWALAEQGQTNEGIPQMLQGADTMRACGTQAMRTLHLACLAQAYGKAGEVEKALAFLDESMETANRNEERYYEAEIHRLRGELLLQQGETEAEVERHYKKAIEVARGQSARSWELRATISLCRLWQAQGRKEEVRTRLAAIYGWFTEGFDTADLKEAKALLDELS